MLIENDRVVLASRPDGEPSEGNFRFERVPLRELGDGEVALQNLYLSVDPYMRLRMSEIKNYAPPAAIGEVMVGSTFGPSHCNAQR